MKKNCVGGSDGYRDSLDPNKDNGRLSHNGIRPDNYVDVIAMIRSLQRSAGHVDCFRQGLPECNELSCSWRIYCMEKRAPKAI